MGLSDLVQHPHLRFNPLRGEWVQVSPHRTRRPWQGAVEPAEHEEVARYDPDCYLCPGAARAGGARNPHYDATFVFDNDFGALAPSTPALEHDEDRLLVARTEPGICRVVCFSPRHDLTLPRLDRAALRAVVDVWADECGRLAASPGIGYVQIFENRGAAMGASNPHPHGQIWATAGLPNEPAREQAALAAWRAAHGRCLLCDYLALEIARGERLVCDNRAFAALVPFWAVWPFETIVVSRRHAGAIDALGDEERDGLADILKRLTTRYDNLFEIPFPYSMGFHQQPADGAAHEEWHVHAHFYPPLLRSARIRKFMVGYEMLATPQRDLTAEEAAARLRAAGEEHYRDRRLAAASRD
jgi:UDPglucose--hexose-1-phosphate uridylyltransferase